MGGEIGFANLQRLRKAGSLQNAPPVRFDAVHVCYDNLLMVPVFSFLAMLIMGTHNRMRFGAHYGSDENCQRQLGSFGVPIAALPVSHRGEFNFGDHRTCMARARTIEATKSKGKGSLLCIAHKVKETQEEKAPPRQQITEEDNVFVAATQLDLNELTGYGGLMSFSNFGSLPQPSFANQWSIVGGGPNVPPVVPA